MKKIILLLATVFYLSIASQIFAQGFNEWIDGVPLFTHIDWDSSQNVNVDSFITLTPIDSFAVQEADFQFILFGLDWSLPDAIRIVLSKRGRPLFGSINSANCLSTSAISFPLSPHPTNMITSALHHFASDC